MKEQRLPKGMTLEDIQSTISKYENQSGAEAVAELEAAIKAGQAFVNIQVPISRLNDIRRLLAKPEEGSRPDAVRKVAERTKSYPSKPEST